MVVVEKGVDVVFDQDAVFPKWFTRAAKEPMFLIQEQGLFLPPQVSAKLYLWANTKTARRLGYVVYERPSAFGPLPFAHTVPQEMLRKVFPNGDQPY